jgi:tripartite-type tricarboxylate transporter receptor subunit TctC
MTTLSRLLLSIAALTFAAISPAAAADDYPSKPVRLIVPFSAGGLNDVVGRLVATGLSEKLGQKFVVENRTGAGGVVGSELLANAAPDGYTLGITSIANAVHPALYKLSYPGNKAFAPVAFCASIPNAFAVSLKVPAKTVKEFIALAKSKPGQLQYVSGGAGGSLHLAFELFKDMADIDVLHIPFKGASPAMINLVGGHSDAVIGSVSSVGPHIRSGKVRGLAVTSKQRSAVLPDTPTFTEAGMPEYGGGNWIGISAPAGTPAPIVDKLNKAVAEVLKQPDVLKQLAARGATADTMTPAEFAKHLDDETATWGRVVKSAGIKAE